MTHKSADRQAGARFERHHGATMRDVSLTETRKVAPWADLGSAIEAVRRCFSAISALVAQRVSRTPRTAVRSSHPTQAATTPVHTSDADAQMHRTTTVACCRRDVRRGIDRMLPWSGPKDPPWSPPGSLLICGSGADYLVGDSGNDTLVGGTPAHPVASVVGARVKQRSHMAAMLAPSVVFSRECRRDRELRARGFSLARAEPWTFAAAAAAMRDLILPLFLGHLGKQHIIAYRGKRDDKEEDTGEDAAQTSSAVLGGVCPTGVTSDSARVLAQSVVLVGMMACSLAAGAVTITQSVNRSPELCRQFLAMVKATGVTHMTDAQLCAFSFARLPASKTAGFTFVKWKVLPVVNPQSMYLKMVLANRAAYPKGPRLPRGFDAVLASLRNEVQHHNVTFYTTTLPISLWSSGPGITAVQRKAMPPSLTFVKMRIPDCSRANLAAARYYAFFTKPDLTASIPQLSLYNETEVALWKDPHGKEWPVAIDMSYFWWLNQGRLGIFTSVVSMAWQPKSWFTVAGLTGSTACNYNIDKNKSGD